MINEFTRTVEDRELESPVQTIKLVFAAYFLNTAE
jgi:hypothetical protein